MDDHVVSYGVPFICVVGECFCVPYPVDLTVKKKIRRFSNVHTDVFDVNGNLILQIDGKLWQLQKKRIMRDPAGFPILTMREKVLSCRDRWIVHRRESSDQSNLLYTVQRSHAFQLRTQLDVILTNNSREDFVNFHVSGSYSDQSFKVYKCNTLIAEVKDKFRFGDLLLKGKESFSMRVYAGVDYAFIVSLLAIVTQRQRKLQRESVRWLGLRVYRIVTCNFE